MGLAPSGEWQRPYSAFLLLHSLQEVHPGVHHHCQSAAPANIRQVVQVCLDHGGLGGFLEVKRPIHFCPHYYPNRPSQAVYRRGGCLRHRGGRSYLSPNEPRRITRSICVPFFSRLLSTAERNYNIGDREFLAVKLPLEEWSHWLKGAEHPFINLEYLQTAKQLNSPQA